MVIQLPYKRFVVQVINLNYEVSDTLIKMSNKLQTIDELTQRIHHLERMRQDFVANVSHELRTPLTVIHGYLETLLELDLSEIPTPKKIFEQIYQQSIRMERLVEDLLLLSRLDNDLTENEKLQTVLVPALLKSIAEEAKVLSGKNKHHIQLTTDENLTIFGIDNELRSIFSNIIFNAINYTPPKGHIDVKWYRKNNYAYFEVIDTGIGIAKEHVDRVTERFYRVDQDRSRKTGGTGLGLAIVKHALLRHKAQLKIESALGKGSKFTCIFPI